MFHRKFHENEIINEDFEKIWGVGTKFPFFQKVDIIFENQRFSEIFDSI